MPDFLITVERTQTYELWVNAPDDEVLFSWNDGDVKRLPREIQEKLLAVSYVGDKVHEETKIIEVIESF